MTLKELSQLNQLSKEIEMDMTRLRELEAEATSCIAALTGMPGGSTVSDRVGRYAAEIADQRSIIEVKIQHCAHERSRLERYISTIDDSLTRQIFTYRFVYCLSWVEVASRVGSSEDSVKKICYRYLQNCPDCPEQP